MLKTVILSATLIAALPITASAAIFTYDFDMTFDMSGDNVGGFRNEGIGGDLTGFFTIDENSIIQDFAFEFEIIQRANRFQGNQTDQVELTRAGGDFFGTSVLPAAGGLPAQTTFGFSEITNSVQCSFQNAVGSPFSLSFSTFAFTPGDSSVTFRADSRRATPSCNQFGGLGFAIQQPTRQQQISLAETGTLRVSAVPLPAGGLLLLTGLAGVAGLKRRKKRAA